MSLSVRERAAVGGKRPRPRSCSPGPSVVQALLCAGPADRAVAKRRRQDEPEASSAAVAPSADALRRLLRTTDDERGHHAHRPSSLQPARGAPPMLPSVTAPPRRSWSPGPRPLPPPPPAPPIGAKAPFRPRFQDAAQGLLDFLRKLTFLVVRWVKVREGGGDRGDGSLTAAFTRPQSTWNYLGFGAELDGGEQGMFESRDVVPPPGLQVGPVALVDNPWGRRDGGQPPRAGDVVVGLRSAAPAPKKPQGEGAADQGRARGLATLQLKDWCKHGQALLEVRNALAAALARRDSAPLEHVASRPPVNPQPAAAHARAVTGSSGLALRHSTAELAEAAKAQERGEDLATLVRVVCLGDLAWLRAKVPDAEQREAWARAACDAFGAYDLYLAVEQEDAEVGAVIRRAHEQRRAAEEAARQMEEERLQQLQAQARRLLGSALPAPEQYCPVSESLRAAARTVPATLQSSPLFAFDSAQPPPTCPTSPPYGPLSPAYPPTSPVYMPTSPARPSLVHLAVPASVPSDSEPCYSPRSSSPRRFPPPGGLELQQEAARSVWVGGRCIPRG